MGPFARPVATYSVAANVKQKLHNRGRRRVRARGGWSRSEEGRDEWSAASRVTATPPILEQIKGRPAHILSATSNPSGVQAFALLYSERFHSTSRNTGRRKNSVAWTEMSRPPLINHPLEATPLASSRPDLNVFCLNVYLMGRPLIRLLFLLLQEENVAISPRAKQRQQLLGLCWRWRPVKIP